MSRFYFDAETNHLCDRTTGRHYGHSVGEVVGLLNLVYDELVDLREQVQEMKRNNRHSKGEHK